MLFNELIEQQGLETVVSKTNISSINLEHLLHENFEHLNRVKALGFLLILEREFKEIEVTELRQRIKLYYEENAPSDDKVVMVAKDSTTGGNFSFFKLFIVSAILGGGYYLYTQGKLDSLIENIEEKKKFFDDNKALESNSSTEDAQKVVVGKSQTDSVHIETPIAPKAETIALNDTESNTTQDVTHKIETVPTPETNDDSNKSIESIVKEVSDEFLAKEANSSKEENKDKTQTVVADTTITTVSINPTRGMLWYGFINLETKKRREFMKKVLTPFSINNGKWLLVTGHGYVDVISDAKTLELADNKKHYFYIDSEDIKEINRKEFRELNGNRGW